MQSHFTVETIKIITTCQNAMANIKSRRLALKKEEMQRLCDMASSSFWHRHPWDFYAMRKKPSYDADHLLNDLESRVAFFKEMGDFEISGYQHACCYGGYCEDVCNELLAAGKVARDVVMSTEDWKLICDWAKANP